MSSSAAIGTRRVRGGWLLWVVPPLLLVLTLLFWPLHQWLLWLASHNLVERFTPQTIEKIIWSIVWAKLGAMWLFMAAGIGVYWILDRTRLLLAGAPHIKGVRTEMPEVIRLRKALINGVYDLEVTRHEVFIDDLPSPFDGFRIAFLTDPHVTGFIRPDFYRLLLSGLKAREGIFSVLGNHDHGADAERVNMRAGTPQDFIASVRC